MEKSKSYMEDFWNSPWATRLLSNFKDVFLFCANHNRKTFTVGTCDSIQITLTGGALSALAHVPGHYVKYITVNGKPSWTKGPYALWWSSIGDWMVGDKDHIGGPGGWLYSSVSGQPYGNTNDWFYYNGTAWVNPIGEIDVGCTTESSKSHQLELFQ